jgi:hypothetical protein
VGFRVMSLVEARQALGEWVQRLPKIGISTLGGPDASLWILDFLMIGALKRSLSLASGLEAMMDSKNMVCARALVRMQLDTVSRIFGYMYVDDPEETARLVIGGAHLRTLKSRDGKSLTDAYLVARLAQQHPWVQRVYEFTSGYVHFSERQVFDSVHSSEDENRTISFEVSHIDSKFPEESWEEVAACFNHLTEILVAALNEYGSQKATRKQNY